MKNNSQSIKEKKLDNILHSLENAIIAFSGGVDSTFLLYKAIQQLGVNKIIAVTANSLLHPEEETDHACKVASELKVKHIVITTDELSMKEFVKNSPNRCYYCKKNIFHNISVLARENGFKAILDGSNKEDENDFRPGAIAAEESGVISPLQLASLDKRDIRLLSREHNLSTWNKPSLACLASRFPYGEKLEPYKIRTVDKAERFLRQSGFAGNIRVRYHGVTARIEVAPDEMDFLLQKRMEVTKYLFSLGFKYVTMDLYGFSSGSMNRNLDKKDS